MYFLNKDYIPQQAPKRIISLVPSQTELLHDLGLEEEVIGITKFCVHPEKWFRSKTRIGGTKTVDIEKIKQLQPDLIIANKEENEKEQVEALQSIAPVWISDIHTLEDALQMIRIVGDITFRKEQATRIAATIANNFATLHPIQEQSALYLIWRKPWMTIGKDTFIHHMMSHIDLRNVYEDQGRYPEISEEDMKDRNPSLVLLSSEPYPFKEQHIAELQRILPEAKIMLVDGEMFSWYGSRLLYSTAYFKELVRSFATPS